MIWGITSFKKIASVLHTILFCIVYSNTVLPIIEKPKYTSYIARSTTHSRRRASGVFMTVSVPSEGERDEMTVMQVSLFSPRIYIPTSRPFSCLERVTTSCITVNEHYCNTLHSHHISISFRKWLWLQVVEISKYKKVEHVMLFIMEVTVAYIVVSLRVWGKYKTFPSLGKPSGAFSPRSLQPRALK